VQRFRGGLVFEAHRLLYHSTLGLRVIEKKKRADLVEDRDLPHQELELCTLLLTVLTQ